MGSLGGWRRGRHPHPEGRVIRYSARLAFATTNNTAEYEALLLGLRQARALGARRVVVKSDSKLVTDHIDKTFQAKDADLAQPLAAARAFERHFLGVTVKHIPRIDNGEADALAKAASQGSALLPGLFFEEFSHPAF